MKTFFNNSGYNMIIERIELRHIKMELVSPFKTSMGTEYFEEHIIVRIDSEGLSGWGEIPVEIFPLYSSETINTAMHLLSDCLIPKILGKNLESIEQYVDSVKQFRGHRMAKAGLEFALFDIFAQTKKKSLAEYLGGSKKRIDVGVSIGISESSYELLKSIETYLSEGYKRIKIKIAPGSDIEFVKAVRKEYPNILLQVDANSAYSLADIGLFKQIDEYNLLLIEQPLGYEDIYQHSLLQKELKTDICLDESIHSLGDTEAALAMESCRVINIKPARVGGIREAKLIHDFCLSKNIPVWHGGMLETGVGRAANVALASLPNFILPGDISASSRYYFEDIIDPPFNLNNDGTMPVPTGYGLGVNIIPERLENVTLRKIEFKN